MFSAASAAGLGGWKVPPNFVAPLKRREKSTRADARGGRHPRRLHSSASTPMSKLEPPRNTSCGSPSASTALRGRGRHAPCGHSGRKARWLKDHPPSRTPTHRDDPRSQPPVSTLQTNTPPLETAQNLRSSASASSPSPPAPRPRPRRPAAPAPRGAGPGPGHVGLPAGGAAAQPQPGLLGAGPPPPGSGEREPGTRADPARTAPRGAAIRSRPSHVGPALPFLRPSPPPPSPRGTRRRRRTRRPPRPAARPPSRSARPQTRGSSIPRGSAGRGADAGPTPGRR